MKTEWRIIRDGIVYEVEVCRWWFPFWITPGPPFFSLEEAKGYVERGGREIRGEVVWRSSDEGSSS